MGILDSLSEEVEGNMKIALLLALAFVAAARAVPAGKSKTAAAALGVGVEQLNNLLNNLGDSETCNAAGCCLWNDWQSRDQQSRIQRTYNRCRYSKQKRTFGIPNGRYYCYYSAEACAGFGNSLD